MVSCSRETIIAINRRSIVRSVSTPLEPIVRLWILRLLVPLGCHKDLIRPTSFANDAMATVLGLGDWVDRSPDFSAAGAIAELRRQHRAAEKIASTCRVPDCLDRNVTRLAELVGLSETDCRILEFTSILQNERLLDDAADCLGQLTSVKVFHTLSIVLTVPEPAILLTIALN